MSRTLRSARFTGSFLLAVVASAFACSGPDSKPGMEEAASSSAKLNPNPALSDLVLGARNSIRLQSGVVVSGSGDVGALGSGSGPFLSGGVALDVGSGAQLPRNRNLIAESVRLGTGSAVGDVQTNRLVKGSGATRGVLAPFVALPAIPAAMPASAGTTNLAVKAGANVSASPGRYAGVTVGASGKLRLASGTYEFASLSLGSAARVEALGPVQIRVGGRLSIATGAFVGAAPGATLRAAELRIEVSGADAASGASGAAASIGSGALMTAIALVPNGTLVFGTGVIARGAFLARDIDVGSGANIAFDGASSGPRARPRAAKTVTLAPSIAVVRPVCARASSLLTAPPAATTTLARRPMRAPPAFALGRIRLLAVRPTPATRRELAPRATAPALRLSNLRAPTAAMD